jgi:hypothetical protein
VAIVESAVARGNRLIEVGKAHDINSVAFVAYEGAGAQDEAHSVPGPPFSSSYAG